MPKKVSDLRSMVSQTTQFEKPLILDLTPSSPSLLDILIITGEPSGDMHAAKLIRQLKAAQPQLTVSAMGGEQLAAAGATTIVDHKGMAVMGFIEAIKIWRLIKKALKQLKNTIRQQRPKVVILVDYSGFNLPMAKFAKEHGAHVLYYIAPQVWAWRQNRVHKIKRWVDTLAVIFPFEVEFYRGFNIEAHFVGHPLAAQPLCTLTTAQAKLQLNLTPAQRVIALLPGSRRAEVRAILPTLLAAATQLYAEHPELQFVLPKANAIDDAWVNEQLAMVTVPIKVTTQNRYTTMQACDIAIAASGTVTLELALLEKPMIIVYKGNPLAFWLAKKWVKLDHAGLPNIIAKREIVPELLQSDMSPENIVSHVQQLLTDKTVYATQKNNLAKIHQQLQSDSTTVSLEEQVLKILQGS